MKRQLTSAFVGLLVTEAILNTLLCLMVILERDTVN